MNYAWEAVLQGEKENRNRNKLRFIEAINPSPYIEVSVEDLNLASPQKDQIEINPFYRLGDVFGQLFDRNIEGLEQAREIFFDVCMHYIVQLDLREGLSKEDYYCMLLVREINKGQYGMAVAENFMLFAQKEQRIILCSYLSLLKTGNYIQEFKKLIITLYPYAGIYENNDVPLELLVYLGVEETKREKKRAVFLREMFLPLQETVHWFFEHHFGIIGVDETMVIDEIAIF